MIHMVKRSLINDHMAAVLNKVKGTDPLPVQKSYLYYSQAEKEAVDYMISVDLLKETTFVDSDGKERKGYVLGDFGRSVVDDILSLQMRMNLQERVCEDPEKKEIADELRMKRREYNSAVTSGDAARAEEIRRDLRHTETKLSEECRYVADQQVRELDDRGNRKMETISRWKRERRGR